ncbi:MAG: thymidylate synthase [Alphaproteobacteria bacterium]|nr:thymidylate synthase [Alphaproteobacteria bacterium]
MEILNINNRQDFRKWLIDNSTNINECWLVIQKCNPNMQNNNTINYLDAVEEALCFGWIDGIHKTVTNIGHLQRFSPRKNNSYWSELNKERCKRLDKLGLMTEQGRKALSYAKPFVISEDIMQLFCNDAELKSKFDSFPLLYQRVRISNIQRHQNNTEVYNRIIHYFIMKTKQGKMYGQWNDYGRLIDY